MTMISVTIPGPSASSSKMVKKGWKCWAKNLSAVATPANDGYAYQGEFVDCGRQLELEIGDVILHVDQSSSANIGVVLPNRAKEGFVSWIAGANSDGRKWCGTLAKPARAILAMSVEERIRHVAGMVAGETRETWEKPRPAKVQAYWEALAAGATIDAAIAASAAAIEAPAAPVEPAAPPAETIEPAVGPADAAIDLSTVPTADLMAELARREASARVPSAVEPATPEPTPPSPVAAAIATLATVSQLAFAFA